MTNYPYQKVLDDMLDHVQYLPLEEQLRLVKKLEELVRAQAQVKPTRSILELEGLGADIWKDVDVEEYINRERDSWDG